MTRSLARVQIPPKNHTHKWIHNTLSGHQSLSMRLICDRVSKIKIKNKIKLLKSERDTHTYLWERDNCNSIKKWISPSICSSIRRLAITPWIKVKVIVLNRFGEKDDKDQPPPPPCCVFLGANFHLLSLSLFYLPLTLYEISIPSRQLGWRGGREGQFAAIEPMCLWVRMRLLCLTPRFASLPLS